MATFSSFMYSVSFNFLIFSLLTLNLQPILAFSFRAFKANPKFDSTVVVLGDAKFVDGGSSVLLTRPMASSFGLLMHSKPFKFLDSRSPNPTSFSTDFTFSISSENGDGLSLLLAPADFASKFPGKSSFGFSREIRFFGVEFDTSMDADVGDENANHVGIDVCSLASAKVSDVSSLNLDLKSGVKLRSWIDYHAISKRLEVRLSKWGSPRPYDALLTYPIDLSEMWKEEEVFVGISSSTGNSSQASSVYSWKFKVRNVPSWMHSQPVDPRIYSKQRGEPKTIHKRNFCPLAILSGLIFVTACGALVAFAVLFLWTILVGGHDNSLAEHSSHPKDFRYEKIIAVVENSSEDGKN